MSEDLFPSQTELELAWDRQYPGFLTASVEERRVIDDLPGGPEKRRRLALWWRALESRSCSKEWCTFPLGHEEEHMPPPIVDREGG